MSQHPSLRGSGLGGGHRNVLKRAERIKILLTDSKWSEEKSVYGLPKVKSLKIKVKKTKEAGEAKPKAEGGEKAAQPQGAAASKAAAPKASAPKAEKGKAAGK